MIQPARMVPAPPESKLVTPSATLPLLSAALRVDASGGIARVVLEQRFANKHPDPLAVTYTFALPADAAVSGFSFTIGERTIEGEIDKRRAARERFEQAIAEGRTAALLDQERSSLFTQELGNVPPGAEVRCEIAIDQRLTFVHEGAWEWRFPLAAAPRFLGAADRVADAEKIALDVAESLAPRASLHMTIADALAHGRTPESPSHPIKGSESVVELTDGVLLDRDLVVRWPVATLAPSLSARAERSDKHEDAHALLTIVPPLPEAHAAAVPRDLIVLLDTSGSMQGAPLDQARRVAMALVDGLSDQDQLDLIEFSSAPRHFHKGAQPATKATKQAALDWLKQLRAGGGTQMHEGILAALTPLRAEAQRQVVLITDGLIGFEHEIVEAIVHHLPRGSRVHTVGVGSAVNRSLTGPAARAGRGVEVVIGLDEDAERATARIRARTQQPIVVDVQLTGDALLQTAPACIPDLYAGAPVLVSARVRKEGGELVITGRCATGTWEQRVKVEPAQGNGAIAALFGREAVEDAETQLAAGAEREEIDALVEKLGLQYRISTRLTSWIAIDKSQNVDPRAPTRRETVPQMLPYGMSVEGLGLRPPMFAPRLAATMAPMAIAAAPMSGPTRSRTPAQTISVKRMTKVEQPRAQAQRPGFIGRAIDAILGGRVTTTPADLVRGRVIQRKGNTIIIHLEILAELDWNESDLAAAMVLVDLESGATVQAKVLIDQTTRTGHLLPGQHAKLVLELEEEIHSPIQSIRFEPDFGLTIPLT